MGTTDHSDLRKRLQELVKRWRAAAIPTRWELMNTLQELIAWRNNEQIAGLWHAPPLMVTATLDDGWGHGLDVIETCAQAAGLEIKRLGLLQSPDRIIQNCRQMKPQLLGLTVLQLDSEEALQWLAVELKGLTKVLAGGPAFRIDPELADRAGVHFVARNALDFLEFLLDPANL